MDELAGRLEKIEGKLLDLKKELRHLSDHIRNSDHSSALNKIRFIAEDTLQRLCTANNVSWGSGEPTIENMIGPLTSTRIIPKSIGLYVRTIQTHASPGSHPQSPPLTGSHVHLAQEALVEFLEWFCHRNHPASIGASEPSVDGQIYSPGKGRNANSSTDQNIDNVALRGYLNRFVTEMRDRNRFGMLLPLEGAPIPGRSERGGGEYALPTPTREETLTKIERIGQVLLWQDQVSSGGDQITAELAEISPSAKRIRNVAKVLTGQSEPVVILGDPGSGKSVTLREVGITLAEQGLSRVDPPAVIYIPLGQFQADEVGNPPDVWDLAAACVPDADRWLRSHLRALGDQSRLILLFDGMDEMDRSHYPALVKALSDFARAHRSKVTSLFACRKNDFTPEFEHRQVILARLRREQILQYIRRTLTFPFSLASPSGSVEARFRAGRLVSRMLDDETFGPLVTNPLLLFLFCEFLKETHRWPTSRGALFAWYVDALIRRLRLRAKRFDGTEDAELRNGWAALAFTMTDRRGGTCVDRPYLVEVLGGDADTSIEAGIECGLLTQTAHDVVSFTHHRLQEYFTAWHVKAAQPSLTWDRLLDAPRWQETLLHLASLDPANNAFSVLEDSLRTTDFGDPELESRAADRVVLASEILRSGGLGREDPGRSFTETLLWSMKCLAEKRPTSQVKMLWACKNIPWFPLGDILATPLRSPIDWVRGQALEVMASEDASKRSIGTNLASEMATDLTLNRLEPHLLDYWKAAVSPRGRRWIPAVVWVSFLTALYYLVLCAIPFLAYLRCASDLAARTDSRAWLSPLAVAISGSVIVSGTLLLARGSRLAALWIPIGFAVLCAVLARWASNAEFWGGPSLSGFFMMFALLLTVPLTLILSRLGASCLGLAAASEGLPVAWEAWRRNAKMAKLLLVWLVTIILFDALPVMMSDRGSPSRTRSVEAPEPVRGALVNVMLLVAAGLAGLLLLLLLISLGRRLRGYFGLRRTRMEAQLLNAELEQRLHTASPEQQSLLISGLRSQSERSPEDTLAWLRLQEKCIREEPASSNYWRMVHDLERIIRQRRLAGPPADSEAQEQPPSNIV